MTERMVLRDEERRGKSGERHDVRRRRRLRANRFKELCNEKNDLGMGSIWGDRVRRGGCAKESVCLNALFARREEGLR